MMMRAGDRVRVTGPPGTVTGNILAAARPGELPPIAGAGDVERAKAILAEWGILQVVMIEYQPIAGPSLTFAAMTIDGRAWFDLERQALTIEKLPE